MDSGGGLRPSGLLGRGVSGCLNLSQPRGNSLKCLGPWVYSSFFCKGIPFVPLSSFLFDFSPRLHARSPYPHSDDLGEKKKSMIQCQL